MPEELLQKLRQRSVEICKHELDDELFRHGHVLGMYWENIARSMVERAHRDARELDVPLFCLQAADQRHKKRTATLEKELTHQLLTKPNLHNTGKLQGMLLLHESMTVRLTDVLAPKHALVKDKLGMVPSKSICIIGTRSAWTISLTASASSFPSTWPRVFG